jgi:hypothetical protein
VNNLEFNARPWPCRNPRNRKRGEPCQTHGTCFNCAASPGGRRGRERSGSAGSHLWTREAVWTSVRRTRRQRKTAIPSNRVLGGGKVSGLSCSMHWVGCQARSWGFLVYRSRFAVSPRLRPNPSLEPTRSGMAPRPPSAEYHVAPVGRGATPPRSPQLKR